jgi:hypothetical protein
MERGRSQHFLTEFFQMTSSDSPQGANPTSDQVTPEADLAKQMLELRQLRKEVDELERLLQRRARLPHANG